MPIFLFLSFLCFVCGCSGEKRSTGERGDQGPSGPAGESGPPGIAGPTGPSGVQGPPGPIGAEGSTGPQGQRGETGELGPTGPAGSSGPQGDPGVAGPSGPSGPSGSAGLAGASGPSGPTGPAGLPGPSGPSGPSGQAGLAGDFFGERGARFVGFSQTVVTGSAGGREAMNAVCHNTFTGSHLCHDAEYYLTNSEVDLPANGAWVDPSAMVKHGSNASLSHFLSIVPVQNTGHPSAGIYTSFGSLNCTGWGSSSAAQTGTALQPNGTNLADCSVARAIACCSTPFRERFSGFTTALVSGAPGGRAAMNRVCRQEFPSSHICHSAEYVRGHSRVSLLPGERAWVDGSTIGYLGHNDSSPDPSKTYQLSAASFGSADAQRLVRGIWSGTENCDNWTNASEFGLALPGGGLACSATARVACCE